MNANCYSGFYEQSFLGNASGGYVPFVLSTYYNYSFALTTLITNAGVVRPRHPASGAKRGWRHCLCVPRICVIHDACGRAAKSQLKCSTHKVHTKKNGDAYLEINMEK